MKEKDVIEFIGKRVKIKTKQGKEYIGKLWGITPSFESISMKDEIDLSIEGEELELGAPLDDIVSIKIYKEKK